MDFITQNLLGAAAGQAALSRKLGRKAALLGAAGGALPDFDFLLSRFADPAFPIEFHRHFTHSIFFIPVGAAIATLPFLAIPSVRRQWKLALAAATIGCATHAVLDCCTSYGTMWYWPITDRRIAWDLISIIDPLFTIPLLIGVIISWRKRTGTGAMWALIWAMVYMSIGFVQRQRALEAQRTIAAGRDHAIEKGRVFPTLGNLLFWRSVYQSQGKLWADEIALNSVSSARIERGESIVVFTIDDLPPAARQSPRIVEVFEKLNAFADGYVAAMPDGSPSTTGPLFIGDMRYSRSPRRFAPLWGIGINPSSAIEPVAWVGWRTSTAEAVDH